MCCMDELIQNNDYNYVEKSFCGHDAFRGTVTTQTPQSTGPPDFCGIPYRIIQEAHNWR